MKKEVALKRKSYRCVVWVEKALSGPSDQRLQKLNEIANLAVAQRTPIRVLHRLVDASRPKPRALIDMVSSSACAHTRCLSVPPSLFFFHFLQSFSFDARQDDLFRPR